MTTAGSDDASLSSITISMRSLPSVFEALIGRSQRGISMSVVAEEQEESSRVENRLAGDDVLGLVELATTRRDTKEGVYSIDGCSL